MRTPASSTDKKPSRHRSLVDPTPDQLKTAYRVAVRSRDVEERMVRRVSRGELKFAIWGPGEEVHGTATALALHAAVRPEHFGFIPHYRSGCLCSMWCELNGVTDFTERMLRQQFSRATDSMSGGRQMVYHLHMPEVGILPVQSPVGMQLGKAAGYALGFKKRGIADGAAMAIIGDGTSAEGDLHDAMNAASVWNLPLIIVVTDNGIAISTTPEKGRGIKDFAAYAKSFGVEPFSCDGSDFWDTFHTTYEAARTAVQEQRPVLIHAHSLPRFNGHSSAADVTYDLGQDDPLLTFGKMLADKGILNARDLLTRKSDGSGRDFFAHHELGSIMAEEHQAMGELVTRIQGEPDPDPTTVEEHIYPPFPRVMETESPAPTTCVTYAAAIRSAMSKLIRRKGGVAMGQDIGRLGGVMTATAGLEDQYPTRVIDSPLNEPLICGVATGLGFHDELMGLPEIQFGDYSFNAFHWLVYWGTMYWSTMGQSVSQLVLRMPTDPFGGGALYHSMSVDGYFTAIPGLVIVMPSTSFDAHGLLLTAGDYDGPVICLEPKWMYRQALGPAIPGEPTDPAEIKELKRTTAAGKVPQLGDVYVPFGKAAIRKRGTDVTIVAWGRAVWTAVAAAKDLEANSGVSAEVIDLRTLVPTDMDTVLESVGRTGRLIVAAEDRPFAGFVRSIQGRVVEAMPHVQTRALGQKNVPGIGQSKILEAATVLNEGDVKSAALELVQEAPASSGAVMWIPPRYFIS